MKKLLLTAILVLALTPQAHAKKLEEVTITDIGDATKWTVETVLKGLTFPFKWLGENVAKKESTLDF